MENFIELIRFLELKKPNRKMSLELANDILEFMITKKSFFNKENVLEILRKRDKDAFDNEFQKYEHREILLAIDIIERLVPPSYFEQ